MNPLSRSAVVAAVVLLFCVACRSEPAEQPDRVAVKTPVADSVRDWSVPEQSPGGDHYDDSLQITLKSALDTKSKGYAPRTHHLNEDGSPVYTNRLILETSPYLLQHAHNPVNWHPWGEEAFETARRLERPVLLSVGYSTCHWCHVMERESFEDVEIATFINEHYVAIKVDREERPDVDGVYMDAVRMLSGRGGWPMTVLLTPDREPFFGGTYFPARDGDRGARTGFLTLLKQFSEDYALDRKRLLARAAEASKKLASQSQGPGPIHVRGAEPLHRAADGLVRSFDKKLGGFGRAPKFPRPSNLEFLLRYHRRTGDAAALEAAAVTLEKMAAGGMYDHVGGGFHRYSVDSRWLVPHFEKMLYDNAQLAIAYLEAYQLVGTESFATTAREVLDYVLREMTETDGGFASATDADSPTPEGHEEEGWFFTWTPAEIEAIVGKEGLQLSRKVYGVTDRGNFEGRNIFYLRRPLDDIARELSMPTESLQEQLVPIKRALYDARAKRPPPGKDTKILAAWNGLMIQALARGYIVLGEPRYLAAAKNAANFVLANMIDGSGRLHRSWREGRAQHNGVLDDYAFFAAGLLELYEADSDPIWLIEAQTLVDESLQRFYDEEFPGGFFLTEHEAEELLVRQKPYYDGALPSGNSVALMNLLRLYELTLDERYKDKAVESFSAFGRVLNQAPGAAPKMLTALDFLLDTPKEIVLVSAADHGEDLVEFNKVLQRSFVPNRVIVCAGGGVPTNKLSRHVPLVKGKIAQGGKATAYVCERSVCKVPTTDPAVFIRQISTVEPYPTE